MIAAFEGPSVCIEVLQIEFVFGKDWVRAEANMNRLPFVGCV
jgi:hypothetical protein